jgi:hypothetical protein
MSRNPLAGRLYIESALLSQRVAELDPFFKEIALMVPEERIKFAILTTIIEKKLLTRDLSKMEIGDLIEEVILPIIQRVGQARFKADVLTNLGMKVGKPSSQQDYQDI